MSRVRRPLLLVGFLLLPIWPGCRPPAELVTNALPARVALRPIPPKVALSVFPGAEGFGTGTRAAYGKYPPLAPTVHRVTNLNSRGPGSLRAALEAAEPRIVIFEVSGTIDTGTAPTSSALWVKHPYLNVAGQTAPSPGITVRGAPIIISTHDVLIQHVRVRPGDVPGSACRRSPENCDALSVIDYPAEKDVYNVVIDHCSFSWSMDEVVSTYYAGVRDVTFRNCIFSEPLHKSFHSKGAHGFGPLIGKGTYRICFVGSLFAHAHQRNPHFNGSAEAAVINNVIYDYGELATNIAANHSMKASIVGNVYKRGPMSSALPPIYPHGGDGSAQMYVADNSYQGSIPVSPWGIVRKEKVARMTSPVAWPESVKPRKASDVMRWVLLATGARPADRDPVDRRIVQEVLEGKGRVINSQSEVGGWPILAVNQRRLELPSKPHADADGNGYTNLEDWLHGFSAAVEGRRPGSKPNPGPAR